MPQVPVRPMSQACFGLFAWVVRREAAEELLAKAFPISGQAGGGGSGAVFFFGEVLEVLR